MAPLCLSSMPPRDAVTGWYPAVPWPAGRRRAECPPIGLFLS